MINKTTLVLEFVCQVFLRRIYCKLLWKILSGPSEPVSSLFINNWLLLTYKLVKLVITIANFIDKLNKKKLIFLAESKERHLNLKRTEITPYMK